MKEEELRIKFNLERDLIINTLRSRVISLERLSRKYRSESKLNLIYSEIKITKYMLNFYQHLIYGHFDKAFLNAMFETFNPRIDYRKWSREIIAFINNIKYKCEKKTKNAK